MVIRRNMTNLPIIIAINPSELKEETGTLGVVAPILGLWVTNVNLSRRDPARAGAESQTKGELFLDFLAIGQEMQMRQNSEECLTNSGPARGNLLFFNQEFFFPPGMP